MNAFDKFTVGQRVVPTAKAIASGLKWHAKKPIIGVVRSIPERYPQWTVGVQIVGQKRVGGYHMDFWEPMSQANTARFGWSCAKCRKRGSIVLSAHIDAWGGSEAVLVAHRVKSPRCRGDAGTVRVTISRKQAAKLP